MDYQKHRADMLQHCIRLAEMDKHYAWWAAKRYARESFGVLDDLPQLLTAALKPGQADSMRRPPAAPTTEPGDHDGIPRT